MGDGCMVNYILVIYCVLIHYSPLWILPGSRCLGALCLGNSAVVVIVVVAVFV